MILDGVRISFCTEGNLFKIARLFVNELRYVDDFCFVAELQEDSEQVITFKD